MPGAMAFRVPKGLSVSIQHLSKGMRPKADVGPPVAPPSRNCGRTLPQAQACPDSQPDRENAFVKASGGRNATAVEPSLGSMDRYLVSWRKNSKGFSS
jgi:hypothetical protein